MKEIDPIEELHRIRRAICKEAGGTAADYIRYYMEMSKKRLAREKAAQKSKGKEKYTGRQKCSKGPVSA